jgi:hypothetical protein
MNHCLPTSFVWTEKNELSVLEGQNVESLWKTLPTHATTNAIPAPSCNGISCPGVEIRDRSNEFLAWWRHVKDHWTVLDRIESTQTRFDHYFVMS